MFYRVGLAYLGTSIISYFLLAAIFIFFDNVSKYLEPAHANNFPSFAHREQFTFFLT